MMLQRLSKGVVGWLAVYSYGISYVMMRCLNSYQIGIDHIVAQHVCPVI